MRVFDSRVVLYERVAKFQVKPYIWNNEIQIDLHFSFHDCKDNRKGDVLVFLEHEIERKFN